MKINLLSNIKENVVYLFFVIMFIVCAMASPHFLSDINLTNILRQNTALLIVCMGMLIVILTGGIDLSVGSIIALSSIVCAYLHERSGMSLTSSIIIALIVGILCGAVSGALIAFRGVAPFIATLAMMTIARSLAFVISSAATIQTFNQSLVDFANGFVFRTRGFIGIPVMLFVAIAIIVVVALLLNYTTYGRTIIAVGSNREAVRLSGINDKLTIFSAYCLSGLFSATAAIILFARGRMASGALGTGIELDAIAACVIGGVSLAGGKGTVMKTVVGVFIMALIGNIMTLLNIPSYPQDIIKGIIIILSVLFQKVNT